MTDIKANSTSQPWGMISLGSGALALFLLSAGCLLGMSYFSMPVAIFSLVAAEMEVEKARRGEISEMSHATMGIVFSTITLGVQFVITMAVVLIFISYILFFFGMMLFL